MQKRFETRKEKSAALLLLFTNVLLLLTLWLEFNYDQVSFDQLLFQLKSPSTGVNNNLMGSAILLVGLLPVGLTALEIWLYRLLTEGGAAFPRGARPALTAWLRGHIFPLTALTLLVSLLLCGAQTRVYSFIRAESAESDFIQEHYVKPDPSILHFPAQKRNLIYIFLESMESSYAEMTAEDGTPVSYIPELEALANDNLNFSHTAGLGGALSYPGTTWTAAAMVAQTAGVPVKVSLEANAYGAEDVFLPGVVSIGQILEEQGYTQELLVGSDAAFHGRKTYFTEHGQYAILDTTSLKEADRLPEDYDMWWGFEDEKLFSFAREELTRLAEAGAPFNFTMLTADTHFPDGCLCSLCGDAYASQYANVLACSSRQVAEFVAWIQAQPFYENTTIVISGDHLTMDAEFTEGIDPDYTRSVYNCVIHPAVTPTKEKNRQFGTFDLFPTTLAALGVAIDGDRLGLGTNLFSDRETLTEAYGYAFFAEELQKQSRFYNSELLYIEEG